MNSNATLAKICINRYSIDIEFEIIKPAISSILCSFLPKE